MSDKLKVLFVHGVPNIGGAEQELLRILERLPGAGYEPYVACCGHGPLVEEIARRGIRCESVPLPPWRKLRAYPQRLSSVRRLREVIQRDPPAILHVNDIWWVPQVLRAVAGMGIPVVTHVRQEIEPTKIRRYELDRTDLVFAVSRQVQESLAAGGVPAQQLRVLYSGVAPSVQEHQEHIKPQLRHSIGASSSARILGTVANLFPRKGYDVMLRALPRVLDAVPDTHYVVIGSGDASYETTLRRMVSDLGLTGRVHFLGHQPSVQAYLAELDLYVHPALMEGFGIAVLEAMAERKPIVATSTGGVPEIVDNGTTGILVPVGDASALAAAIVDLLRNPARASAMGQAGWRRATEWFSLDAMIAGLTSGYERVLHSVSES